MKTMKKLTSLLLVVLMIAVMATPVMAADYNLTLPAVESGTTSRTYDIYQIFKGDVSGAAGAYVLSNVQWGANGVSTSGEVDETILNAIAATAGKSDAEKLAVITQYANLEGDPFATGTSGATVSVAGGYYLVKDKAAPQGESATTYLVAVVGPTTMTAKVAKPTLEKSVEEANEWKESADREIGKEIRYKLTATLAEDVDFGAYKTYKVVFNDTMSAGLTYDSIESVTVTGKKSDGTVASATIADTDYSLDVSENKAGASFALTIADLKTAVTDLDLTKGVVIEVIYKAHLNEAAIISGNGNDNTANLEYSNDPNNSASGDPANGKTPDKEAVVFAYELDVTKVDGADANKKLKDAEFILYNADGEYAVVDNAGKVTNWTKTESEATTLKSDTNGLFKIAGLDDGKYYLKETKAPEGYNLLDAPIEIVIDATTSAFGITELTITVDDGDNTTNDTANGDKANGIVATTVKNNVGATLPETGGMGTTIFYALGGLLAVGAVILLVTKRRMDAE